MYFFKKVSGSDQRRRAHAETDSVKQRDWFGYTTPALINEVYRIADNNGHNFGSQGGTLR